MDWHLGLKKYARLECGAQRKKMKGALGLSELSIFGQDNIQRAKFPALTEKKKTEGNKS